MHYFNSQTALRSMLTDTHKTTPLAHKCADMYQE